MRLLRLEQVRVERVIELFAGNPDSPPFTRHKWRFYADNDVPREVVEVLRKRQMDILWITEVPELRREQDDSFHYQKAAELGRY